MSEEVKEDPHEVPLEYYGNEAVDNRGYNFTMVNNSIFDESPSQNGITKPSEIAVFSAIARHMDNKDRTAFPSMRRIAAEARVSERTARSAIKVLEKNGYMKVEPQFFNSSQTSNLYKLTKR